MDGRRGMGGPPGGGMGQWMGGDDTQMPKPFDVWLNVKLATGK